MKILVTGAKGQLGNKIKEILGSKHKLILTDAEDMDITDKLQVYKVIKLSNPDFIIHGAAYTRVDDAEENVDLCKKINSIGTKNIAEAAREFDIPLIYISTDYVFDGKKTTPYTEEDKANPLSIYGLTKYEGEKFVRDICNKHYILRVSWLFGELPENHPGSNFIETMLRLGKERDFLSVVSDQIGSPTYTKDLVEIFDRIINISPDSGTYHFSGANPCSWYDFAKEIFKLANTKIDLKAITSKEYPQKAKRPPYSYLSKDKIEKTLDIKVRPWQEMVSEYINNKSTVSSL